MNIDKKSDEFEKSGKTNDALKFLNEAADVKIEKPSSYSLNDEFTGIKSHKSYFIYAVISSFTIALLLSTYIINSVIIKQTSRIEIDINDFEDINMKELFDKFRDSAATIDKMERDNGLMRANYERSIDRLKIKASQDIARIEMNRNISSEKKEKLINEIRARQNEEINIMRRENENKIKSMEKALTSAKNDFEASRIKSDRLMNEYSESVNKKLAYFRAEADTRLSREHEIYSARERELEAKLLRQKQEYDESVERMMREQKELASKYRADLQQDTARSKELEENLARLRHEYGENTKQMNQERENLGNLYKLENLKFLESEKFLTMYRYALNFYSTSSGEHGIVIDPRNESGIVVQINPVYALKPGMTGYVLTRHNNIIAMVEFSSPGGQAIARVTKKFRNETILPFDKVLLITDPAGR